MLSLGHIPPIEVFFSILELGHYELPFAHDFIFINFSFYGWKAILMHETFIYTRHLDHLTNTAISLDYHFDVFLMSCEIF